MTSALGEITDRQYLLNDCKNHRQCTDFRDGSNTLCTISKYIHSLNNLLTINQLLQNNYLWRKMRDQLAKKTDI